MFLAAQPKGRPLTARADVPEIRRAEEVRVGCPNSAGVLRRTVGHVKAVDGISTSIRAGHTIGVVGESGSGKTTLGLALLRLERSEGGIYFAGRPIQGMDWKRLRPLRKAMQIVFQIGRASCRERGCQYV